ncbi:hypothetical protein [Catenulispora pinisilvae]|uniref:hypothetical protein n=1 Tax=Catenulispora pinisilvae TaxID=2705253 RepID=UPI0018925D34|nr:hypothetical protein [Catenulispora pinisilvae]
MNNNRRLRIPAAALGTVLLAATGVATVAAGSAGAVTANPTSTTGTGTTSAAGASSWQENLAQAHSDDVNTAWTGHALAVRDVQAHTAAAQDSRGYAMDTFPAHTLSAATNQLTVVSNVQQPSGSRVEVDVRGQAANGTWTEWTPAGANGATRLSAAATLVQTRVTMWSSASGTAPSVTSIAVTADANVTAAAAAPNATATPLSYKVFATDEGLVGSTTANGHVIQQNDHFVALPSTTALSPKGSGEYSVQVCGPVRCETAPVWDVGPWNIHDNYWDNPRAEFTSLPQGEPEAQAAYDNGYNGDKSDIGSTVVNPAGIDLADGTFSNIGLTDNGDVTVTYLWTSGGGTPPPPPAQTPAETAASSTLVHDGYTSVYSVDSSNSHLQETYLPKMGGSWATQDLSTNYGTPAVLAGTQPVAIYHDGYTSIYTVDASNHHLQETYLPKLGGPWATQDLTNNYGAPATSVTPTTVLHQDWLSVYTIDQSNGHLQETYLPKLGGPWYSKDLAAAEGAPASANIKPVSIMHGGYTSVYTVDAGTGHVRESYIPALGQNWATQDLSAKYSTPATTVAPTVAVHQGWTSVYTINSNGHLQETYLSAIGQPWYSKDLVPQSGTPAASLNTAPVALYHNGYTSVYTVDAGTGHLEESYISQLGASWTSQDLSAKYGTPNPAGNIDALVHPDANQAMTYASVYSLDAGSNQLQETYLSAIGSPWRTQSLSIGYGTPAGSVI